MAKSKKETSIQKIDAMPTLKLSKEVSKRLKTKLLDRNEDLILDYLEQIEVHKREIAKLIQKVNELTDNTYMFEDENV